MFFPGTATVGASNDFPASSPAGGNFVAADGDFSVGAITQTVAGLTVGLKHAVSFYWAAAQQTGYRVRQPNSGRSPSGARCTPRRSSTTRSRASPAGSQTFTYTATSASQVLLFLAAGTPSGAPPFSLIDGVSIAVAVAEPASWMTLVAAMLSIIGVAHLKRRSSQRARLAAANGDAQPAGHAKPRRRRKRSYAHAGAC